LYFTNSYAHLLNTVLQIPNVRSLLYVNNRKTQRKWKTCESDTNSTIIWL